MKRPGRGFLRKRRGGAGVPASLAEFGDVQLWYNRKRSTSTPAGSGIGTITDISGNGRNVTQTADARRPTLSTLNGNVSWLFDGVDDVIDNANFGTEFGVTEATFILVITPTNIVSTNNDAFRLHNAGGDNRLSFRRNTDDGNVFYDAAVSGTDMNMGLANCFTLNGTKFVIARVRDGDLGGSNAFTSDNITATGTGPTGPAIDVDRVYLGANINGVQAFAGHIHELAVFSRFFSNEDQTRLEQYARQEWIFT